MATGNNSSLLDSIIKNKNHSFEESKSYKPTSWCDAQDYEGVWRLGRVRKAEDDMVLVNFDGWSDNQKQWICKDTEIIAPLRTHTIGYTGQQSTTLREFEFNSERIVQVVRKLKFLISEEKLQNFDAYNYTVFVRGDIFVLVDSILTYNGRVIISLISSSKNTQNKIDIKDSPTVRELFVGVITLGAIWMKSAPKCFEEMLAAMRIVNEKPLEYAKKNLLHVQNQPASIYLSGYEILLMLKAIFGFEKRCLTFYQNNSLVMGTRDLISQFFLKEGLTRLIELLKYETKTLKEPQRIDYKMLSPLIYAIPYMFDFGNLQKLPEAVQQFTEALYLRLKKESESEKSFLGTLKADPDFEALRSRLKEYHDKINQGTPFLLDTLFEKSVPKSRNSNLISINLDELDFDVNYSSVRSSKITTTDKVDIGYTEVNTRPKVDDRDSIQKRLELDMVKTPSQRMPDFQTPKNNPNDPRVDAMQREILKLQEQMKILLMRPVSEPTEKTDGSMTTRGMHSSSIKRPKEDSNTKDKDASDLLTALGLAGFHEKDLIQAIKSWKNYSDMLSEKKNKTADTDETVRGQLDFSNYPKADGEDDQNPLDEEFKVLTLIELLLSENKVVEAMKVIKWRKKIIRIANMNGWDVARIVAGNTFKKLDVTAEDILFSNLTYLQHNEHILNVKIFDSPESK